MFSNLSRQHKSPSKHQEQHTQPTMMVQPRRDKGDLHTLDSRHHAHRQYWHTSKYYVVLCSTVINHDKKEWHELISIVKKRYRVVPGEELLYSKKLFLQCWLASQVIFRPCIQSWNPATGCGLGPTSSSLSALMKTGSHSSFSTYTHIKSVASSLHYGLRIISV
jgi:hypothetical protein